MSECLWCLKLESVVATLLLVWFSCTLWAHVSEYLSFLKIVHVTCGNPAVGLPVVQAKCTLGDETRLLHVGPAVSYAEMLEGVRMKFDNPGPFSLKFTDK